MAKWMIGLVSYRNVTFDVNRTVVKWNYNLKKWPSCWRVNTVLQARCQKHGWMDTLYEAMTLFLWNISQANKIEDIVCKSTTLESINTSIHWGRNKMAAISQTTFRNAFSWIKRCEIWFKFHFNLFPMVQVTIRLHLFRWCPGAFQAPSHYLNRWSPWLLTHICVTRPQWVKPHKSRVDWVMSNLKLTVLILSNQTCFAESEISCCGMFQMM